MNVRVRLDITGVVQGVGFRPAVARIAAEFRLGGLVYNDAGSVHCELEGPVGESKQRSRRSSIARRRWHALTPCAVDGWNPTATTILRSSAVAAATTRAPWSHRTSRYARTACAKCVIRPTVATATRSSPAPTAGRATR